MSDYDGGNAFAENESLGGISFRDCKPGQSVVVRLDGTPKLIQSMDMETGQPKFWKNADGSNGKPVMAFVFPVTVLEGGDTWTKNTAEGDDSEANPVGERLSFWVGKSTQRGKAISTLSSALFSKRGAHLDSGDVIRATLEKLEKPTQKGRSSKKIFKYEFLRHEETAANSAFGGEDDEFENDDE